MAAAAGSVHCAPGDMVMVQMATSASGRAAHEFGGGAGGAASPSLPATTVTSVVRPPASRATCRGTWSFHNIVK